MERKIVVTAVLNLLAVCAMEYVQRKYRLGRKAVRHG